MPPAFCGLVPLLAALAVNPIEGPSSEVTPPVPRSRQVVIPEVTSAPGLEVRLAPHSATTFRFEALLDPAAFVLERREEFFTLVEPGAYTVTLEPGKALPEEGLSLTVGFAKGGFPEQVTFTLLPASSEVDAQLRLVPPPRSVEVLQARLDALRARCEAGAFVRLVLSGRLGGKGITVEVHPGQHPEGEFKHAHTRVYRAEGLALVEVRLRLSGAATKPWVPGEARLVDESGRVVGQPEVWLDGMRLDPGEERALALEVELTPGVPPRLLRLEIQEKEGERSVQVKNLSL